MTPVSLEHIRQLQVLLLRMRAYLVTEDGMRPSKDNIMRCEQLGYDHMSLTGKGHVYLEEYADGVELLDPIAYKLVHRHFRDLTYNFLSGYITQTAEDVIAAFNEQLAKYAQFLAEHTPPVTPDAQEIDPGMQLLNVFSNILLNAEASDANHLAFILDNDNAVIALPFDLQHLIALNKQYRGSKS